MNDLLLNQNIEFEKNESAQDLWDACNSTILYVNDENGVNVYNACCRHLLGNHWIYCDDSEGYSIVTESEVDGWHLSSEKSDLGYHVGGEVR